MSEGGILTGNAICKAVRDGTITIDPWVPGQVNHEEAWELHGRVNSGSYDLLLGDAVAVYRAVVYLAGAGIERDDGSHLFVNPAGELDAKKKNEVYVFNMDSKKGWLCKPGIGYLMHTRERILTYEYGPVLDGKSSIGRLFTTAHVTAGYGDSGFNGQYTLEVTVTHPTRVYPGMRFSQIRFHTMVGEPIDYSQKGHYVGAASIGPVPSMTWKQFEEEAT